MTDEEKAKDIRERLISALTVVNGIIDKADREGFNVNYNSRLIEGKFDIKIDVSKKF